MVIETRRIPPWGTLKLLLVQNLCFSCAFSNIIPSFLYLFLVITKRYSGSSAKDGWETRNTNCVGVSLGDFAIRNPDGEGKRIGIFIPIFKSQELATISKKLMA